MGSDNGASSVIEKRLKTTPTVDASRDEVIRPPVQARASAKASSVSLATVVPLMDSCTWMALD